MSFNIFFIEKSTSFNANDLNSSLIGGSEKTLINITDELGKNSDFEIKVFNNNSDEAKINNVNWLNIKNINKYQKPDCCIAMSDANLLTFTECKNNYLWSHSVQSIEKFIRNNQLYPFIKNKPILILESDYHYNTRSFFTSIYGKKILKLAPDYEFINTKIDPNFIPARKAIFNTRSDRNLDFLLECWEIIYSKSPNSKLYINPPFNLNDKLKNIGVCLRSKVDKNTLINELIDTRVMLNPGHKGEVFCLAAEEARELCIPLVTMGIGALKERVTNNITGFIANNKNEFVNHAIQILNEDNLYLKIKNNLLNTKGKRSYKNVAEDLINIINRK